MGNRVRTALGAALVVMVIAAGCSDGDGNGTEAGGAGGTTGSESAGQGDASDIEAPAGSDPELRQQYIDAIVDSTDTDEASGFDSNAIECLATAFVDAAGTDALSAAVTPDELANAETGPAELGVEFPDDAGDVFYDELSGCVDLRSLILGNLAGQDDTARACLDDAIDDELLKEYTVGLFIGGLEQGSPERDALEQRLDEALGPCLPSD